MECIDDEYALEGFMVYVLNLVCYVFAYDDLETFEEQSYEISLEPSSVHFASICVIALSDESLLSV